MLIIGMIYKVIVHLTGGSKLELTLTKTFQYQAFIKSTVKFFKGSKPLEFVDTRDSNP